MQPWRVHGHGIILWTVPWGVIRETEIEQGARHCIEVPTDDVMVVLLKEGHQQLLCLSSLITRCIHREEEDSRIPRNGECRRA